MTDCALNICNLRWYDHESSVVLSYHVLDQPPDAKERHTRTSFVSIYNFRNSNIRLKMVAY